MPSYLLANGCTEFLVCGALAPLFFLRLPSPSMRLAFKWYLLDQRPHLTFSADVVSCGFDASLTSQSDRSDLRQRSGFPAHHISCQLCAKTDVYVVTVIVGEILEIDSRSF